MIKKKMKAVLTESAEKQANLMRELEDVKRTQLGLSLVNVFERLLPALKDELILVQKLKSELKERSWKESEACESRGVEIINEIEKLF